MRSHLHGRMLIRWSRWIPLIFLYQTLGCLPDNAFAQVTAENITFTGALVIQSITSLIFNTIFSLGVV